MPKVNAYLSFDGTAAEAMRFYEKALGAKLDVLVKVSDVPNAASMSGADADKVLHAQLSFGNGNVLMASDSIGGRPYEGMKGFSVALAFEEANDAKRAFDVLAKGGMAILPLQPSFFAKAFGMLIDRFGTPWAISGGTPQN